MEENIEYTYYTKK